MYVYVYKVFSGHLALIINVQALIVGKNEQICVFKSINLLKYLCMNFNW